MKVDLGINPKYVRIAIWVVVAVVVFILLRKGWNWYKKYRDNQKLMNALKQGIKKEELSYTEEQYTTMAERLYGALNDKKSGLYGVNQEEVYNVFRMIKTPSDLLKLNDVFGVREFDFAWTARANDGSYTLLGVITESRALTDGEREKIREILAENGVTNFV